MLREHKYTFIEENLKYYYFYSPRVSNFSLIYFLWGPRDQKHDFYLRVCVFKIQKF